jgi:hypothetical protein
VWIHGELAPGQLNTGPFGIDRHAYRHVEPSLPLVS